MGFVKVGDAVPISNFLGDEKPIICDKCGKEVNTIKLTADRNEAVCECEDEDDE